MNTPPITNVIDTRAADHRYLSAEGEFVVRSYSKILCRFGWVSFDTKNNVNRKRREIFARYCGVLD